MNFKSMEKTRTPRWNEKHLGKYQSKWRTEWQNSKAHWLKGKWRKAQWHMEFYRGRWYLLRGKIIIAKQYIKKDQDWHFDKNEFFRYCNKIIKLSQKRRRYLLKKRGDFDNQMQFFTAYHYAKKQEENNEANNPDLYDDSTTFYRLMHQLDSTESKGWRDIIDEDDQQHERRKRLEQAFDDEELF